jgi:hypothetical protein
MSDFCVKCNSTDVRVLPFNEALTLSPTRSTPVGQPCPALPESVAQSVLCFGTCTETPCNPKRSPLSEMTCPASATAVFSLLPVPSRIASNSALESASGPSDKSRSRGLSSGGSCFMVYLRVPTLVFYIIQASAYRISALQQVTATHVSIDPIDPCVGLYPRCRIRRI